MLTKVMMLLLFFTAFRGEANGQIYYTKNGNISFFPKPSSKILRPPITR